MANSSNKIPAIETLLPLENYIEDSVETRKWLLEMMFEALDKIDNQHKSIDIESLKRFELSKTRGVIQIDLVAKLMMYIEDLVIILEANRKFDGNYYTRRRRKNYCNHRFYRHA